MNLYKGLLFLHGHVIDPAILDDVAPQAPARGADMPARAIESAPRTRGARAPHPAAVVPAVTPGDCCA
ncbi:hypothetical protein [Marilutibacter aestuarii]|uniref:Uncharacterized protein n=1 Tax=Marilutibacter aestuarii TaxID=1706195 RepID=A0A508AI15_9GAMM|nr:hypothetical protein [Lysobacter aestuarii]TQD48211.1 hypothetical protein FKV25_05290 [Lysobacter aestuarii]